MNHILKQVKRSMTIAKKDIKIYYSKGPVVIFGLILPLFLFLAYTIGREMPIKEMLSKLISMTAFFTATSVGPSIIPWEARSKTLERLLCCPITLWAILLGDMLSSFIFGFLITLIPTTLTLTLNINPINFISLLFSLTLATLCFSALSILLSSYPPTDIPATIMMISTLIKFPLIFISGIFIPIEKLPPWARIIASLSPLTYYTDLTRQLILNKGYYPPIINYTALIIFTITFLITAIKIHEKTLIKRIS
ncbi:MAG: ABC transporter permease [archaeon GB-1867-005]|nr:ABC transporter permease [Candidatus Culexmicrobium cathedralense]